MFKKNYKNIRHFENSQIIADDKYFYYYSLNWKLKDCMQHENLLKHCAICPFPPISFHLCNKIEDLLIEDQFIDNRNNLIFISH